MGQSIHIYVTVCKQKHNMFCINLDLNKVIFAIINNSAYAQVLGIKMAVTEEKYILELPWSD